MKNILLKCNETKQDPYLALLQYRNTPTNGVSPAQALMNRQLNTTLATAPQNLKSEPIDSAKFISQREKQQQKQKLYHDQSAKPLPELHDGESVRIKKSPEAKWEPAIVLRAKYQTPRSYLVQTSDGTVYRRNRRHLLKTKEPSFDTEEDDYDDEPKTNQPPAPAQPPPAPPPVRRQCVSRYGWVIINQTQNTNELSHQLN